MGVFDRCDFAWYMVSIHQHQYGLHQNQSGCAHATENLCNLPADPVHRDGNEFIGAKENRTTGGSPVSKRASRPHYEIT